jgi:DNA adenine methylase
MDEFLRKNTNKDGKYKRIVTSPLRYAGGKSMAVCLIIENLPTLREKKIVSPFFGGGSFELCMSQHLDHEVVGYDIFGMLVNFWNVLIHQRDAFVDALKKFEVTDEEFTLNRHILLNYWNKIKPKDLVYRTKKHVPLTDEQLTLLDDDPVQQAAYYYYSMTLSYGPMFLGWPSKHEINPQKFARRIKKISETSLKNLSVHTLDFQKVLEKHRDDFLFLDPPYYLGKDSKMFKGMYPNTNFAIHHNGFEHERMRDLLKEHRGGFLITYNDCDTIREWYKDYKQVFPKWAYTYGQGETRIGKNRPDGSNVKESHEIFIICEPI